uniref:ARAD1C41822p n=1 Tax=Blastobotrys adeninivorans TaxID=409370 RepID=A0A060T981_BLAAD
MNEDNNRNQEGGGSGGADNNNGNVYYINYSFTIPSGGGGPRFSVQSEGNSGQGPQQFNLGDGIGGLLARMFGAQPDSNANSPGSGSNGGGDGGSDERGDNAERPGTSGGPGGGAGAGGNNNPRFPGVFVFGDGPMSVPFAFPEFREAKPRASRRAVARLKQLDVDSLDPNDRNCPICYEVYEKPNDETTKNKDKGKEKRDDQIPVSISGPMQVDHATDCDEDPPASVPDSVPDPESDPTAQDPPSSVPMDDSDPPESVPDPESTEREQDNQDPPTSVPEGEEEDDDNVHIPDDHRPIQMPCGHNFGLSCIREWLNSSNTCPLCRTTIESHDEYLRATGQQQERTRPVGLFDFLFTQLPNIIWIHHNHRRQQDDGSGDNQENRNQSNSTGSGSTEPQSQADSRQAPWAQPRRQDDDEDPPLVAPEEHSARHTFVSSTEMGSLLRAFPDPAVSTPRSGPSSGTSSTSGAGPITDRDPRQDRHHPYLNFSRRGEDLQDRPHIQCATIPLGLCVSDDDHDPVIGLECTHGYHESCLRMCMRAHGDRDIPNLATDQDDGGTREVWCTRCRRYRPVTMISRPQGTVLHLD